MAVGASAPFVQIPSDAVLNYPRLQVTLNDSAGAGTTVASRQSTATWAGVNVVKNDDNVCVENRGVA